MSKIVLSPSATGTGVLTIETPSTNTNRTIVLPDESGTIQLVPPALPMFSVHMNGAQAVTVAQYTKAQFNVVDFDTRSWWDAANFRYIPQQAGYYQFSLNLTCMADTGMTEVIGSIYKNGVEYSWAVIGTTHTRSTPSMTCIAFMNGTTDYVEGYGYITAGTNPRFGQVVNPPSRTKLLGVLLEAA